MIVRRGVICVVALLLPLSAEAKLVISPCNAGQIQKINSQTYQLNWILDNLLNDIKSNDPKASKAIKKWLGRNSVSFRKTLTSRLAVVKSTLNKTQSKCVSGPEAANDYAYVYPSDETKTIYYGPLFFKSGELGKNSMLGTILHEHLHFHHPNENIKGTDDVCLKTVGGIIVRDPDSLINECIRAYGEKKAASLLKYGPKDAKDNSDNFQFMIEEYLEILLKSPPPTSTTFFLLNPH